MGDVSEHGWAILRKLYRDEKIPRLSWGDEHNASARDALIRRRLIYWPIPGSGQLRLTGTGWLMVRDAETPPKDL